MYPHDKEKSGRWCRQNDVGTKASPAVRGPQHRASLSRDRNGVPRSAEGKVDAPLGPLFDEPQEDFDRRKEARETSVTIGVVRIFASQRR